ncbi:tRNA-queuosine alpha-mannosyltransferase domain-containing protein [Neptunomonas antarctica]|uniref:tRNA-queuosine alpha-mannosyltransferase n=1 Tax=Neptunomonas antarctica TaxID=619304 RepID=A0A1N7J541_9GAMM|nr:DUF3524 domain-containing protein [Neptunomonas antarctica]SIS44367.1 Glycosyltransferase involved in cell wall bisynthesis [Neptunomonas antarctica]
MHILLLSAYDADSHQYWHKGLVTHFPEHQWTVLTLPARYFSWRLRGNSLSWAFGESAALLQQPYDLIIATSMTDLSSLRGFVPALSRIPTLLYFHENQFAYPESGHEFKSVEPKILNLYSALAADHIVFNTHYNRDTFLNGASALLKKLPDFVPAGLSEHLQQHSSVLPVPLNDNCYLPPQKEAGPLHIVWNHRWEFDKGPELLYEALAALHAEGVNITCSIVGQQFRKLPDAFNKIKTQLPSLLSQFGYVQSASEYRQLLQTADVVLSTALHDFQGIAVLEGVAAGAIPVIPDRLAYTELFDSRYRYATEDKTIKRNETASLVDMLKQLVSQKESGTLPQAPNIDALRWQQLKPAYQQLMDITIAKFAAK